MSWRHNSALRAIQLGLGIAALVIVSQLVACNPLPTPTLMPIAQVPSIPPTHKQDLPSATATSTDLPAPPTATRAPVITLESDHPMLGYPTPSQPGMVASDAELLFSAPVPQASEIMEWRPPCVAVPHSLHPNDHYWLRRPIPSGKIDWGLDWYTYGGNGMGQWQTHHGMDFPNDPGTPVLAAGDGVVVLVKGDWTPVYVNIRPVETPDAEVTTPAEAPEPADENDSSEHDDKESAEDDAEENTTSDDEPRRRLLGPYGNFIIIRHDWGWRGQAVYTLYGHLLEVFVEEGDWVQAGDLIAGVGNTGASSGPHLHFEVRVGQNEYSHTVNPALWLAPYAGWGTLAGRLTSSSGNLLYNAVLIIAPVDSENELEEPRILTTYADYQAVPDESWRENFIISDLPAGNYRLSIQAGGERLSADVTIRPGVTTFLKVHTSPGHAVIPTPLPSPSTPSQ